MGLLHREFSVIPAQGEEVLTTRNPAQAVKELSRQKAEEVEGRTKGEALILGADTVVALEGEILGKPASEEEAFAMLKKLQGKVHSVFTGVTILVRDAAGGCVRATFAEETRVTVSPMTDAQILWYIGQKESLDKAGAYGIQGAFSIFVEGIEGDYQNVVGLPLSRVYREAGKLGVDLMGECGCI